MSNDNKMVPLERALELAKELVSYPCVYRLLHGRHKNSCERLRFPCEECNRQTVIGFLKGK
jgi:hypothetical protein